METLGQLEPATLGQHADAVVTRLKESDEDVRQAALMTLGKLEPTTLAQHSDAVVAMLYDSVWAWRLLPSRPVGPEGPIQNCYHAEKSRGRGQRSRLKNRSAA